MGGGTGGNRSVGTTKKRCGERLTIPLGGKASRGKDKSLGLVSIILN